MRPRPGAGPVPGRASSGADDLPNHLAGDAALAGRAALSRAGDVRPRHVHRAHRGGHHGPARGGETVVRQLIERAGRRILRAFDEPCPERIVDADNETDIRGVVVFVGNTV